MSDKNCKKCYWKFYWIGINKHCAYHKEFDGEVCDKFSSECSICNCNQSEFKYENEMYCQECLFEELGVEPYSIVHYSFNGEYIGNENDMREVLNNLDCFKIEELD